MSKLTNEEFDRLLIDIMNDESTSSLLTIPGIYEILSEHFNNDVLERWDYERQIEQEKGENK